MQSALHMTQLERDVHSTYGLVVKLQHAYD